MIGNPGDRISGHYQGLKALANGNYVVISSDWNGNRGAVTWGNGSSGTRGVVSAANSLVGNKTIDAVGLSGDNPSLGGGVFPYADGNYVIISRYWDNGNRVDTGAVSLGKSNVPVTGIVSAENSVLSVYERVGFGRLVADYDPANRQMVVGRPDSNAVTIFRYEIKKSVFDFDGDSKTDIGIFRPSDGSWWYVRSSDSQFRVFRFGVGMDKPVQGDWTGDGKADIAVFRESTGEWFFQRSEDNSFYSVPFGAAGDVPAPGDYDGDGRFDTAVFRPSNGTWYVNRSTAGLLIAGFGANGDRPAPAAFVP